MPQIRGRCGSAWPAPTQTASATGRRTERSAEIGQNPSRTAQFLKDFDGIQRALGRLLMLEVRKHIASGGEMLPEARHHRFAFFQRIAWLAIAIVGEVGGHYVRSVALLGFGHAQSHVAL